MKARGYPIPGADLGQIATLLHAELARVGFDVRVSPAQGGLTLDIQRPAGVLQRGMGRGAVLKCWLTPTPVGFSVRIGTEGLGDAAAGAVEWLLGTPALVTEGYAAFQQSQVDERIFRVVDAWAAQVARVPVDRSPAKVPVAGACPSCRAPVPYGARFCPRCGHDHARPGALAACASCKGPVALDAVFCPHCGKSVAAKSATKDCPTCKTSLERDAVFCSGCGAKQEVGP